MLRNKEHKYPASQLTCALWVFFLLFLFACSPQKRLNRLCAAHPEMCPQQKDSIREWTSFTCDSFPVYIKAQELSIDTSGIIPPSIVFHSEKKKGNLTAIVDIKGGKLSAQCKEDSLLAVIEHERATNHKVVIQTKTVEVPVKDGWYTFWRAGFWICLALVLATIAGLIFVK